MKTRECKGCEGTGCEFGANHPRSWCACPCPACQGSGRVVEPDSKERIRQALEDAETLHGLAPRYASAANWPYMLAPRSPYRAALRKAAAGGVAAAWADTRYATDPRLAGFDPATSAYWDARHAARAAFRAVPGLRG